MKFDPFYGMVPLVGVELEVQSWKGDKQYAYSNLFKPLYKSESIVYEFHKGKHEWRCKCSICYTIGNRILYPVQWKTQHDGSLPPDGVEYISSIFPTVPYFVDQAMASIRHIASASKWNDGLIDIHGKPSYPSFHVHCSLDRQAVPKYYYSTSMLEEVQRCLVEYYPELIALAASCGYNRPNIHFRTPRYKNPDDGKPHHIFIAPAQEHFEWRIWEAPPDKGWYYEAAIYTSASLTQALLDYNVLRALEGVALTNAAPRELNYANTEQPLIYIDKKRFKALEIAATECSTIVANPAGVAIIKNLFAEARAKFL